MGHIKILKISKETPKDVPETLYGPYRHYRCEGTGGRGVGGPSRGYVPKGGLTNEKVIRTFQSKMFPVQNAPLLGL